MSLAAEAVHALGSAIEVWCPSTGRWVAGFTAEQVADAGATVRRNSDGAILPVVFGWDHVRRVADSPAHQFAGSRS